MRGEPPGQFVRRAQSPESIQSIVTVSTGLIYNTIAVTEIGYPHAHMIYFNQKTEFLNGRKDGCVDDTDSGTEGEEWYMKAARYGPRAEY